MEEKILNDILLNTIKNDSPSHAYLFISNNTDSLTNAAVSFSKGLLCKKAYPYCDKCITCDKINNYTHPDIIHVYKDGNGIKINQIRKIKESSLFSSVEAEYKIFIIHDAQTMAEAAQNAFLKTLEEPSPKVIFILLSNTIDVFLPTVISRCTIISLKEEIISLTNEQSDWILTKTENLIYDKNSDLVDLSKKISDTKENAKKYTTFLLNFFCDVLIYKRTDFILKKDKSYLEHIENISKVLKTKKLNYIISEISTILSDMNFNLNISLAMLSLLIIIQEELYAEDSRDSL